MNKARRKMIERAVELIADAHDILSEVYDEEQEAFDNMPESLQYSERGESMETGLGNLEEIVCNLEYAESDLNDIIEN